MTGLLAEMRPYLALWRPAVRIALGSWAGARRAWRWCAAGEGSNCLWRALGAVCIAGSAYRVADMQPMLVLPATVVWLVAAWRRGPADPPVPAVEGDEELPEPEPAGPPPIDREQLLAALHHVADPHAQTVPLADHLATTTAAVRGALTREGIPLTGGVRMRGRSVSPGVRAADIPPLPAPSPAAPVAVVDAGQASNNNTEAPTFERPQEGLLIVRHPVDRARRYLLRHP